MGALANNTKQISVQDFFDEWCYEEPFRMSSFCFLTAEKGCIISCWQICAASCWFQHDTQLFPRMCWTLWSGSQKLITGMSCGLPYECLSAVSSKKQTSVNIDSQESCTLSLFSVVKPSRIFWEPDQKARPVSGASENVHPVGARVRVQCPIECSSWWSRPRHSSLRSSGFARWKPGPWKVASYLQECLCQVRHHCHQFQFSSWQSFCVQLWRKRARQGFGLRDLDWGGFPVEGRREWEGATGGSAGGIFGAK